jgi:replicative DNA helicase
MASFKESGAVEYSSDVLLALQYEGMDWKEGESEKDRNARVRTLMSDVTAKGKRGEAQKIQVKVLKNRNGSKGDCCLDFIPMFNCFMEAKTIKTAARAVDNEGFMPLLEGQNPFEQ